ncbi:MAG: T9SS type A sorting domain-containing protein [Bacteroidia bacterium]
MKTGCDDGNNVFPDVTGNGDFMTINSGSPSQAGAPVIYLRNATIPPGCYTFSFRAAHRYEVYKPFNQPRIVDLRLFVGGGIVGDWDISSSVAGQWNTYTVDFTLTNPSNVAFLQQYNIDRIGDDFSIDDIHLEKTPHYRLDYCRQANQNNVDTCGTCDIGTYFVEIDDENGVLLDENDPCFNIEWLDNAGIVISTGNSILMADVNRHYTARVTNTCTGCSWEEDFFYECCGTPTNPRCVLVGAGNTISKVLHWDAVPGAQGYIIQFTTNDPRCCDKPIGPTQALLPIHVTTNSYVVPPYFNHYCASWTVRTNCSASHSEPTDPLCLRDCNWPQVRQGIADEHTSAISIYPSPASQYLNVESSLLESGTRIRIMNPAGKVIATQEVEGAGSQRIKVSDLPNGIYFLQIQTDQDHSQMQKVVIFH